MGVFILYTHHSVNNKFCAYYSLFTPITKIYIQSEKIMLAKLGKSTSVVFSLR